MSAPTTTASSEGSHVRVLNGQKLIGREKKSAMALERVMPASARPKLK